MKHLIFHFKKSVEKTFVKKKEVVGMFNFPVDTFWLIVPWPFIWMTLGIVMYFIKKRDDDWEDKFNADSKGEVKK